MLYAHAVLNTFLCQTTIPANRLFLIALFISGFSSSYFVDLRFKTRPQYAANPDVENHATNPAIVFVRAGGDGVPPLPTPWGPLNRPTHTMRLRLLWRGTPQRFAEPGQFPLTRSRCRHLRENDLGIALVPRDWIFKSADEFRPRGSFFRATGRDCPGTFGPRLLVIPPAKMDGASGSHGTYANRQTQGR